jgi:hypothetical protein
MIEGVSPCMANNEPSKQEALRKYVLYTAFVLLVSLGGIVVLSTDVIG